MKVAITGASGMIGGALAAALRSAGTPVCTIGRRDADFHWNPATETLDSGAFAGVSAVVHLAGATIAQRWTDAHKRSIRESRVQGTKLLAGAIAQLPSAGRPAVLVCASAVGYYGSRGDEWLDESSAHGEDFLAGVCTAWEAAAQPARDAGVRVTCLRQGIVLGAQGGALARLVPVYRFGGGGRVGDGRQWMSWIGLHDLVRAIRFCVDSAAASGPMNAVAPNPVTNAEFTQVMGRVLHRPTIAALPAFAVRTIFGEMGAATLLASQRVRPARLLAAGFSFDSPTLADALRRELTPAAGVARIDADPS